MGSARSIHHGKRKSRHEARAHHGDHGARRVVSRRVLAREGIRSARAGTPEQLVQHRPHRPHPRPASSALRGPGRLDVASRRDRRRAASRGLQPGRPEPRARELRDARVHVRRDRRGRRPPPRGTASVRREGALLPGVVFGALRQGRGDAADGEDAVSSALPLRRREGLRVLPDPELPRGLRHVLFERPALQP